MRFCSALETSLLDPRLHPRLFLLSHGDRGTETIHGGSEQPVSEGEKRMLNMKNATRTGLGVFMIAAFIATMGAPRAANAQGFSATITIDENGHGLFTNTGGFSSPLSFALQTDPGPGGRT